MRSRGFELAAAMAVIAVSIGSAAALYIVVSPSELERAALDRAAKVKAIRESERRDRAMVASWIADFENGRYIPELDYNDDQLIERHEVQKAISSVFDAREFRMRQITNPPD